MDHQGLRAMSKKLEKRATRLVRKAEYRALAIRQAVREYREIQVVANNNPARQLEGQLDIERAVVKYNRVHKALRRVRKKIQIRHKDRRSFRAGAVRTIKHA